MITIFACASIGYQCCDIIPVKIRVSNLVLIHVISSPSTIIILWISLDHHHHYHHQSSSIQHFLSDIGYHHRNLWQYRPFVISMHVSFSRSNHRFCDHYYSCQPVATALWHLPPNCAIALVAIFHHHHHQHHRQQQQQNIAKIDPPPLSIFPAVTIIISPPSPSKCRFMMALPIMYEWLFSPYLNIINQTADRKNGNWINNGTSGVFTWKCLFFSLLLFYFCYFFFSFLYDMNCLMIFMNCNW